MIVKRRARRKVLKPVRNILLRGFTYGNIPYGPDKGKPAIGFDANVVLEAKQFMIQAGYQEATAVAVIRDIMTEMLAMMGA